MAAHRLGRADPARDYFSRLEETMKKPVWARQGQVQDEARAFVREAERQLNGGAGKGK
jgi:hypothetical protein